MPDFGNDVALVALVISLVALIVTTGQLLQQYAGTADGLRRCQNSVMGPWSSYTRLKFKWSEFRFETRFTTPEIQLLCRHEMLHEDSIQSKWSWRKFAWETLLMCGKYDVEVAHDLWDVPVFQIRGESRHATDMMDFDIADNGRFVPRPLKRTVKTSRGSRSRGTDLVTWTRLLRSLHQYQENVHSIYMSSLSKTKSFTNLEARISIRLNEWSWDLVPPDLVRPFATSTIGTFVCLAHRLGMQWQVLEPSKGSMSAEGQGHSINCTSVRGLGIVLQYSYNSRLDTKLRRIAIPTHDADKLRCGIIPYSDPFMGEYSLIGADEEHGIVIDMLRDLGVSRTVQAVLTNTNNLKSMRTDTSDIRHVYNDMVCIASPWLPLENDLRNGIVWPIRTFGLHSPLIFWEGRVVLFQRLREYVHTNALKAGDLAYDVFSHVNWIQSEEHYHSNYYCKWDTAVKGDFKVRRFLWALRAIFEFTSKGFADRQEQFLNGYSHLVAAHITMATEIAAPARQRFDDKKGRTDGTQGPSAGQGWVPFMFEIAHSYVDNLPRVVQLMKEKGCRLGDKEIEAMWWMLMLRGICWSMSLDISLMKSVVPSYLYYSATPVYII